MVTEENVKLYIFPLYKYHTIKFEMMETSRGSRKTYVHKFLVL